MYPLKYKLLLLLSTPADKLPNSHNATPMKIDVLPTAIMPHPYNTKRGRPVTKDYHATPVLQTSCLRVLMQHV